MVIPKPLEELLAPLFEAMPVERAMPELVPTQPGSDELAEIVRALSGDPLIKDELLLQAGLWLYVDRLERSHEISQSIPSPAGSIWHGMMHRREGDFGNSKYWFRQAGHIPALDAWELSEFVDRVEPAYQFNPPELLDHQRKEWQAVFAWTAGGLR